MSASGHKYSFTCLGLTGKHSWEQKTKTKRQDTKHTPENTKTQKHKNTKTQNTKHQAASNNRKIKGEGRDGVF
jgi:hypothetical protein